MIELHSIDVHNFRAFTQARFEPSLDGMTAISGGNGAGKSSLIHALLWALYGITPDGVAVRGLRKENTTEPVMATVEFRHDDQTVVVTRSLRGKGNTTAASITVDGVAQTAVSARTATAWVEQRLGLDSEGFLTAFVVRQKELDDLVTRRPADRRKTIERLAGIERMADAVKRARETARDHTNTLNAIADPEMTVADADDKHSRAVAAHTDTVTAAAEAATAAAEAATAAQETTAALTAGDDALKAHAAATQAHTLAVTKLESAQTTQKRLNATVANAADLPAAQNALQASEDALRAAQQLTAAAEHAHKTAQKAEKAATEAAATHQRQQERANTAKQAVADAQQAANAFAGVAKKVAAARTELQEASAAHVTATVNSDRITASIAALTESHDPECPTCEQPLDDPSALLHSLESAAEVAAAAVTQTAEAERQADQRVSDLDAEQQQAEAARIAVATATSAAEAAVDNTERAQRAAHDAQEAAATEREHANTAVAAAQDAHASIEQLTQQVNHARQRLSAAEQGVQAAEELATLQEHISELAAEEQRCADEKNATQTAQQGIDRNALAQQAEQAQTDHTAATAAAAAATGAQELAAARVEEAAALQQRVHAAVTAKDTARVAAEQATRVATALNDFRMDRLARLAPELSEVASDFVARMTDGKFTTVELDEDFTPLLTDVAGNTRTAAQLSGGEESAVALALRVAIGEVLAGQRGGLLILDEVLTALDETRRTATVAAIRELPRQVVTINHVSEASDMVDHVVLVTPDEDGSTITVDNATSGALPASGVFE